eukprot:2649496-Heterocapsa_arctica.AAC.1
MKRCVDETLNTKYPEQGESKDDHIDLKHRLSRSLRVGEAEDRPYKEYVELCNDAATNTKFDTKTA